MRLTLFTRPACSACTRVDRAIEALGLDVDKKNIWADSEAMNEIVEKRGLRTVPVLRIDRDGQEPEYVADSRQIVQLLETLTRLG